MSTKLELYKSLRNEHLKKIPASLVGMVSRAFSGKSKATAVKAKCLDCVGFEDPRERIGNCESWRCPLHPYRPYQYREKSDE